MDYGYGYGEPTVASRNAHRHDDGNHTDGYGADEDVREHVIQKRSARRASLKAGRRSSATGTDAFAARKARRASMNGSRRNSFAGSVQSSVQGSVARRASAGYGGGGSGDGGCDPLAVAAAVGKPKQQQANNGGINPDALRRLMRECSDDQVIDDDDESSFNQHRNNPYGYGYEAYAGGGRRGFPAARNYDRRPSNASRASQRSRRRSSHANSSRDHMIVSEISTSQRIVSDSDIEDLSEGESICYRYGYGAPSNKSNPYGYGNSNAYDSDANSSRASRRSHRRNSCVIRKNKDAAIMAEIEAGPQLVPDSDLESEPDHKLRNNNKSNPYGYGDIAYDSDANASHRSTRSHRRNSCVIRKNKDAAIMAEIESGPQLCPDSDLDSEDNNNSNNRGMYGYGAPPTSALPPGCGYDSDSTAGCTISSTRPTARRNSCLNNGKILEECDGDRAMSKELSDPDSLLSRSGYYNKNAGKSKNKKQDKSIAALPTDGEEMEDDGNALFRKPDIKITTRVGADPIPVNKAISGQDAVKENMAWSRSTPFTTAHAAPTKDILAKHSKHRNDEKDHLHKSWGEMDIISSSSDGDSDQSFGASMYKDDRIHVEIDRYKQRARRRASIEASYVDLKYIAPTEKIIVTKEGEENKVKVPPFKPAEGCSKASDFIVRCFSARLRSGITVLKHNRNRFSKSQYRVLYLLPDGKTLTWKPLEGEKDKGKRPKLDLSKCIEVRHAYSPDPERQKLQGTAVLRKNCKDGMAARSMSLIFGRRTLDITALSKDLTTVLLEGFSALCFRLHLLRMEEDKCDSDENNHPSQQELHDEDWASTILGAPSTADITLSIANSNPGGNAPIAAPWGF